MQRLFALPAFALLAVGLFADFASTEEPTLREEIDSLQRRAEALETQRDQLFEQEVRSYLSRTEATRSAQGGAAGGPTVTANFTTVFLATVGADPYNRHSVHGDVDLQFDFSVTDNLSGFVNLTANTDGAFPSEFGGIAGPLGSSTAAIAPGTGGATMSGIIDGIGVDGTVPTSPGSVRLEEAGIRWSLPVASRSLLIEMGKIDPRHRYAQNRFADDENTQFLNNLFDDPPAVSWPTNATGTTIFGLNGQMNFGGRDQYTVDLGWYNRPGQFFNNGLLFFQLGWNGELLAREINVRIYVSINTLPTDESTSAGVSADWWATESIGVFVRITAHDNQSPATGEINQVESDWQIGAVFNGLIPSRPDDTLGVAWGYMKGPVRDLLPGSTENNEMVIEIYYRFVHEDGLEISPLVQFVVDPGAGSFGDPDQLILLGVRMHVPF